MAATKLIIFVVILTLSTYSSASPWTSCGSNKADVVSVEVSGCGNDLGRCKFPRGTKVTIAITFKMKETVEKPTVYMSEEVSETSAQLANYEMDGCKLGVPCPVLQGTTNTITSEIRIEKNERNGDLTLTYKLFVGDGLDEILCVQVPATFVDPPKETNPNDEPPKSINKSCRIGEVLRVKLGISVCVRLDINGHEVSV